MREQRLLEEGLAVVDLSHRDVITVTGPDRLSWLHSLTTQHLLGLEPRQSREALVLTPKGHVEHSLHLVDDGATTWITTEPGAGQALVDWLDKMRFMLRVEVALVTDDWAVLGEPHANESVDGEPLAWRDPWPDLVGDTAAYGPVDEHPGTERAWREVIVPRADLVAAVGDRPLAGTVGCRGAAHRRVASTPRSRDRPPHDRPGGRLAAHGRAPAQGLLPRTGDGRAGPQPRQAAAASRLPPPRRVAVTSCRRRGARSGQVTASSAA